MDRRSRRRLARLECVLYGAQSVVSCIARNVGLGFQLAGHRAKNQSELFLDRIEPGDGVTRD
jgi:hypothetical protein